MSHWNHRVLVTEYNTQLFFMIHEVHYNDEDVPDSYTENGTAVCGETIEEMKWVIDMMQQCLSRPVLWAGERFPEEYGTL